MFKFHRTKPQRVIRCENLIVGDTLMYDGIQKKVTTICDVTDNYIIIIIENADPESQREYRREELYREMLTCVSR